jgi:hypothetical protein
VHRLVRGLEQVGEERGRRLAQPALQRGELAELEQPHPQPDAVRRALHDVPLGQLGEHPVRGGLREAGAPGQLGQRELGVAGSERGEQRQGAAQNGLRRHASVPLSGTSI